MISIITMTYNGAHWLKRCMDSFYKVKDNFNDYEWIIMDAGSTDNTKFIIQNFNDPKVKHYKLKDNDDSFSKVNNIGANYANGKFLFFVNNDIEFKDFDSVFNMIDLLEKYNAGCVGAKLLYSDGKIQHAGVIFRPNHLPWHMRDNLSDEYLSYNRKYQAVTAACMICKNKDFFDVGKFDESYYFCFEDIDLCLKMKSILNKESLYCAKTKFIHHESRTILALNNKKQRFIEAAKILKSKWSTFVEVDENKYLKDVLYKALI